MPTQPLPESQSRPPSRLPRFVQVAGAIRRFDDSANASLPSLLLVLSLLPLLLAPVDLGLGDSDHGAVAREYGLRSSSTTRPATA
jgi:hypothetical protein